MQMAYAGYANSKFIFDAAGPHTISFQPNIFKECSPFLIIMNYSKKKTKKKTAAVNIADVKIEKNKNCSF